MFKHCRVQFEEIVENQQVNLIGKKTQKTTITMEHLAIKCHWTEREAAIGDVIPVSSLKPKKKPGKCGRGHV